MEKSGFSSKEVEEANYLLELLSHPGYKLLKESIHNSEFLPNESLTGDALREDIYYKACQVNGIRKIFSLLECKLYLYQRSLKDQSKGIN